MVAYKVSEKAAHLEFGSCQWAFAGFKKEKNHLCLAAGGFLQKETPHNP